MAKSPVLFLFSLFLLSSTIAFSYNPESDRDTPQERLQKCKQQCRQYEERGQEEQRDCERHCQRKYEEERGGEGNKKSERETNNPYFFDNDRFTSTVRAQEGNVWVLEKFSERSDLLRGIDNYRVAVLEANPNTFILPHHCDAEAIIYVMSGNGTINLLRKQNKESYNLKRGDILRIHAGTTVDIANTNNKEKLYIGKLIQPVFTPGHYESFFGAGGKDPESFYWSFSSNILEAALKTPRDRLERLLGQRSEGAIIKATPEQIREMSKRASSSSKGGHWPFGTERSRPYNLFEHDPAYSNQHGKFYEVDANDYPQLRDLDISISFASIRRGSMVAPYYNSKATKVALVVDGKGYFEMACPHLSSKSSKGDSQRTSYEKVSATLKEGNVFVVPAGHPFVQVASQDEDLLLLCFELNARNNVKYFLAGQNVIWNQMDKEEKELSFNVPAKEVEEIFNAQDESVLLKGPQQQQRQEEKEEKGRSHGALESILDFAGL